MRLVEQMRVDLLRGGRCGMSERLADIICRNARLIGQRRECVPQLMQYDLRQIVIRKELAEQLGQIIRPERPPSSITTT